MKRFGSVCSSAKLVLQDDFVELIFQANSTERRFYLVCFFIRVKNEKSRLYSDRLFKSMTIFIYLLKNVFLNRATNFVDFIFIVNVISKYLKIALILRYGKIFLIF